MENSIKTVDNVLEMIEEKLYLTQEEKYRREVEELNRKYMEIAAREEEEEKNEKKPMPQWQIERMKSISVKIQPSPHSSEEQSSFDRSLTTIREKLADGKVSAQRVFDIITYKSFTKENYGKLNAENIKGSIEFKNVKFQYDSNCLFENLNFKIECNKMIAIVGKSGEGKSTILKLINKSYNTNDGEILIDNYNINSLSEQTIRNNISVVAQSPYIFNLSIKENIKLANFKATDEEIEEVCKKVQLHDIIVKLPDGYNTTVGENGVILSGGQKQRLAIARALIKKSKIILFDEATSSLDNNNQEKIKNIIKKLSKDHTVIIVAHRLSTIIDSDCILVLDKHGIINSGTHNELIEKCPEYKKLYEIEY